ncbi:hypothetical protein B0H11DRAFT_2284669 [Mycena galericulata]|nr:hypothetical protein B0H11DRAFT_2284669 [Mycena galericulata]
MSTSNLSPHNDPQQPPFEIKRRRTIVACSNCRKRKMRCTTTEQPPKNPCARCTKKNLPCEYLAATDRDESDSGESPTLIGFPPGTYRTETSPILKQPVLGPSQPRPVSNQPSMYAAYSIQRHRQYPHPSLAGSVSVRPGYHAPGYDFARDSSRPSFPAPASRFYEIQAEHARQYLAKRQARSLLYPPTMTQTPAEVYPIDYSQFRSPDSDVLLPDYEWPEVLNSGGFNDVWNDNNGSGNRSSN